MKKFKFIKLIGFAPLVAVPLIAAGCNGGDTNNPPNNQAAVGKYIMNGIVARLGNKENYVFSGGNPASVSVYQAGTTKAFDNANAYNFINTNGNPKTEGDVTTYKFMGNTGNTATSVIPFATLRINGNKGGSDLVNISISFFIQVKNNAILGSPIVAIDRRSSAVELYSYIAEYDSKAMAVETVDGDRLAAFFGPKNLVNIYNWMYKTKNPKNPELAGGATDTAGVVKFPIAANDKATADGVNLPKGTIPKTTPAVEALKENYIAFGEITYNAGPKKQEVFTIAIATALGLEPHMS